MALLPVLICGVLCAPSDANAEGGAKSKDVLPIQHMLGRQRITESAQNGMQLSLSVGNRSMLDLIVCLSPWVQENRQ